MSEYKIPDVKVGHIHLTVLDMKKSLHFYKDVLGFEVQQDLGQAVFLSSAGYHHTIGLNTWHSASPQTPAEGQVGLYHIALLYPTRKDLANILKRLIEVKYPLEGFADHGVSESIYLSDPDGNGIELYSDKPKSKWPKDKSGKLQMSTLPLDIDELIKEAD